MKNAGLFFFCLILIKYSYSQFSIPLPQVFAPNNQIFLSPNGNDNNTGSINSPKKTFQAALTAFPFGISGQNNSHSYNEIVFLAGDYYPTQTLSQTASQFLLEQNGIKRYKHVSVRGIGKVIIHGDSAINAGYSALLALMGSHIYVKNITLKDSKYGGIKFIGGNKHANNILVDSLVVENAPSHGCLFTLADTIWVKNSIITNTCNENSDEVASNCQWGSGLKTEFCKNITFEANKVYRNWGEGINTSLSEGIICRKNIAYDNYSTNFYLHSGSKGIWEGNVAYNEDSAFWRSCYNNGKRFPPSGFSVANELTCTYACVGGGNNQNCGGKYHCCAYTSYDAVGYLPYIYPQTDSVFIYNNVVLQADIDVWDAFSGFFNYGFVKNIFIENNTVIGVAGRPTYSKFPIKVNLGTPFVSAQNIQIKNNIFAQDTLLSITKNGLSVYIPSGVCNGLTDGNIVSVSDNLWNYPKVCTNTSINTTNEHINLLMPTLISPTQLADLVPNSSHSYWIQTATSSPYISKDFWGNTRMSNTNVGAFEQNSLNEIAENIENEALIIFPNPAQTDFFIQSNSTNEWEVKLFDMQGQLLKDWAVVENGKKFNIQSIKTGLYFLYIKNNNTIIMKPLHIIR